MAIILFGVYFALGLREKGKAPPVRNLSIFRKTKILDFY
jgi:hypothetical protein